MTAPLRFGVLGCAEFARRRMLPAVAATPGCELRAIGSRRLDRAEEAAAPYPGCRAVAGYDRVLGDDAVDAVYVPLPAALHADWAEAALRAGKHVLVEKPLALRAGTAARLLALAARLGLALAENVLFVHHDQHAAVRDLVSAGAVGELRAFDAAFAVPRRPPTDIRLRPELGGGALWDTGVYPLRAATYFLGAGLAVAGAARTVAAGVDIAGSVLLADPAGVGATVTYGLDHEYRNHYTVWGSRGRITVERAFTPPADRAPEVRLERGTGVREIRLPARDQAVAAVGAFAAAARRGSPPDAEDLLEQARLRDDVRAAGSTDSRPRERSG